MSPHTRAKEFSAMIRIATFCAALLLFAGCQVTPDRTPLKPLPEETVALPYPELLTRARAQATNATAAFYVNKWDELEDSARGLEQTARFLAKAQEVPVKHKDTLAVMSNDLGKEAVKLREAAKTKNVKDATQCLQQLNLKIRELRLE
jgi:hypothetical protein